MAAQYLSKLDIKSGTIDTKVAPREPGAHSAENLRKTFQTSLQVLGPKNNKVRVLYLHAPDRSVPFEETCGEIDRMHKEGIL